jgi:FkbM family methyltransferase
MPRWLKSLRHLNRIPEVWRCLRQSRHGWPLVRGYLGVGTLSYPRHLQLHNGIDLELRNVHDLVTAWVIFFRNEYHLPPDASVVLDLGANYGAFTLFAARTAPNARVISVEPFPPSFERLAGHVGRHQLDGRVHPWPFGVAASAGTRQMPLRPDESPFLGLLPPGAAAGGCVDVQVLTLPEVLDRVSQMPGCARIDFLKVDIEGAEHEIFRTTPPAVLARVRRVGMEYHPSGSKKELFAALEKAGLVCVDDRAIAPDHGVAHFARTGPEDTPRRSR